MGKTGPWYILDHDPLSLVCLFRHLLFLIAANILPKTAISPFPALRDEFKLAGRQSWSRRPRQKGDQRKKKGRGIVVPDPRLADAADEKKQPIEISDDDQRPARNLDNADIEAIDVEKDGKDKNGLRQPRNDDDDDEDDDDDDDEDDYVNNVDDDDGEEEKEES